MAAFLLGPSLAAAFDDFGAHRHVSGLRIQEAGEVRALALQVDGSTVIATSGGELLRYLDDGTLASSFVVSSPASAPREIVAVAALPDGRSVAAVSDDESYSLLRFRIDGSEDRGFRGEGAVTSNPLRIDALAIQGDGAIVVSGQEKLLIDGGERWRYIVVRHHPDGSIDGAFGVGGVVRLDFDNREAAKVVAAPLADGGVIIASAIRVREEEAPDILVARIDSAGIIDTNFGSSGAVRLGNDDADERASAILVQPDGAVVVAGTHAITGSGFTSWMLVRLLDSGGVDPAFGESGMLLGPGAGTSCSAAHALAQLPDQTLMVAGALRAECAGDSDFLLLAVAPDGRVISERALDLGGDEEARALAVQPNGRVLLAGGHAGLLEVARIALGDPPPAWDLEPDAFHFGNVNGAHGATLQVSEFRAVEQLDPGILVPLRIEGGEYALNGSSQYTQAPGWVRLGDEISVRHVANARPHDSATTRLIVGGIQPANNLALILGPVAVLEFTSVTGTIPDDAGGGGALGPFALALLGLLARLRWRGNARDARA